MKRGNAKFAAINGIEENALAIPRVISKAVRICLGLLFISLVVLDIFAVAIWQRETQELRKLATSVTAQSNSPSEKMRAITRFIAHDVPRGLPDEYFLLPVFRPLKPTALQVTKFGGDCAYKARACIVMLHELGISASKLALYDQQGTPVHAVALVDTELGEYVVDLHFGIVLEDVTGAPIPLESLRDDSTQLAAAVSLAIAHGNDRALKYPLDRYVYSDSKTINWHKNGLTAALYQLLVWLVDADSIDNLKRPFISEEPALMVVAASCGAKLMLFVPWFAVNRRRRRLAKQLTSSGAD